MTSPLEQLTPCGMHMHIRLSKPVCLQVLVKSLRISLFTCGDMDWCPRPPWWSS